jgi:probable HAF family extracellular repeat protein
MRLTAFILLSAVLAACADPTQPATRPNPSASATGAEPAVAAPFRVARRDLGTFGAKESRAIGINNNGAVVGYSEVRLDDTTVTTHPFRWTAAGGMRDMAPTLGRDACGAVLSGWAQRINRSGQVAGTRTIATDRGYPCQLDWTAARWSPSNVQDLGTLYGGTESRANDVNVYNRVAGWSNRSGGAIHATLWTLQ